MPDDYAKGVVTGYANAAQFKANCKAIYMNPATACGEEDFIRIDREAQSARNSCSGASPASESCGFIQGVDMATKPRTSSGDKFVMKPQKGAENFRYEMPVVTTVSGQNLSGDVLKLGVNNKAILLRSSPHRDEVRSSIKSTTGFSQMGIDHLTLRDNYRIDSVVVDSRAQTLTVFASRPGSIFGDTWPDRKTFTLKVGVTLGSQVDRESGEIRPVRTITFDEIKTK